MKCSWEYVDEQMTMPRFAALTDYWRRFPPEHISLMHIKGGLGVKTETTSKERTGTDDYVPPEFQTSNDLTQLVAASPFSDAFGIKKLKVIEIDTRKKN
jgi:hypothetical protein